MRRGITCELVNLMRFLYACTVCGSSAFLLTEYKRADRQKFKAMPNMLDGELILVPLRFLRTFLCLFWKSII